MSRQEWPRVLVAWQTKVFMQLTIVAGWTLLVAVFVAYEGISRLPLLYGVHGTFVIVGTLLFSSLFRRISPEKLMYGVAAIAIVSFSLSALFFPETEAQNTEFLLFLAFYFIAQSYLLGRLTTLHTIYVETLFTPLEAQRTSPIIETGDAVGGILGGLLVFVLAQFLAIGTIILFLPPFLIFFLFLWWRYSQAVVHVPVLHSVIEERNEFDEKQSILPALHAVRKTKFLAFLTVVVFLQWTGYHFLEFQYTRVIDATEISHFFSLSRPLTNEMSSDVAGGEASVANQKEEGVAFDAAVLAEALGLFHMLFFVLALAARLLVAGKLFGKLGFISAGAIYPWTGIVASTFAILLPGAWSVIGLRALTEGAYAIHQDAYHNIYYGMKLRVSQHMKVFLETFIRPLGALVVTIVLSTIEYAGLLNGSTSRILLILQLILFCVLLWRWMLLQEPYTGLLAERLAEDSPDENSWALDILSQRGHTHADELLLRNIDHLKKNEVLLNKCFHTLAHFNVIQGIPLLLEHLRDERLSVRTAACDALLRYHHVLTPSPETIFTRHRVEEELRDAFQESSSPELNLQVMQALARLNAPGVVTYLIGSMGEKQAGRELSDILAAFGLFGDPGVIYYVRPYLDHEDSRVRAEAVNVLWQFSGERERLLPIIDEFLTGVEDEKLLWGTVSIGNARIIERADQLTYLLTHSHALIRFEAALALAKMKNPKGVGVLVESLCSPDRVFAAYAHHRIFQLDSSIGDKVRMRAASRLSVKIRLLQQRAGGKWIEDYPTTILRELRDYYERLDAHAELLQIDAVFIRRKESRRVVPFPHDIGEMFWVDNKEKERKEERGREEHPPGEGKD